MKLLFDQNLSRKLPGLLSDLFPASSQVLLLGMSESTDAAIWEYAHLNDFIIVSKDADFQQRSFLLGHPPKCIWLRVGNCSTPAVAEMMRVQSVAIHTFASDPQQSLLVLP